MEVGLKLSKEYSLQTKEEKTKMVNIHYQNAVDNLMHAMGNTRPDIAYVVNSIAQYSSNHGEKHWLGIKRTMRYLKGMMGKMLIYRRTNTPILLQGYSNVDWVGDVDTKISTT
jgi:N-glycosylase/DNA lyase